MITVAFDLVEDDAPRGAAEEEEELEENHSMGGAHKVGLLHLVFH